MSVEVKRELVEVCRESVEVSRESIEVEERQRQRQHPTYHQRYILHTHGLSAEDAKADIKNANA